MMKKLSLFFSLNRKMKGMLVEAFLYLGWARLLKIIPFSKVAPSLGEQMVETTFIDVTNRRKLAHISQAILLMSRYTVWESECLVRAIAAKKMLEARRID